MVLRREDITQIIEDLVLFFKNAEFAGDDEPINSL